MKPKVTIIIVAYNVSKIKNIFKKCLDSSLNLKYDNYEVVVVNNGSTDETKDILMDYENDIKIINLKHNVGYAQGNNIAYNMTKSDFVLLLNSDAIPEQDSLQEVVKEGMKPDIGAVGGIQMDYNKKRITALGRLFDIYMRTIVPKEEISINEVKASYYTYIPASFLLIKRSTINTLFPKEFFTYWEDVELCMRLWSRGYKVLLIPQIVCAHEFGTSARAATKHNVKTNVTLKLSYTKNGTLLLSIFKKYLIDSYLIQVLNMLTYSTTTEMLQLPRYFFKKQLYDFTGGYFPGRSLIRICYLSKPLSTLQEFGRYYPLLAKLNNTNKIRIIFDIKIKSFPPVIQLCYDNIIITEKDIEKSNKKFIIDK
ncbi:MAG TPA: glycosyltransferase family 2 protein [Geobacterales bacterium]|nr:glycosyltransferase family 2 protein [Geobacterales bacterium]